MLGLVSQASLPRVLGLSQSPVATVSAAVVGSFLHLGWPFKRLPSGRRTSAKSNPTPKNHELIHNFVAKEYSARR